MNSRCEDLSSVDQIDSGANSSKEDEVDNNRGSKSDEQKRLQSCDQQVNSTSDQESTLEDGQEHSESNQDTITANTTKCDTKQSGSSLPGSIAQYRLGKSKGIESSTDTLVAELDERNGSNEVNNEMAADQDTTNDIIETSTHSELNSTKHFLPEVVLDWEWAVPGWQSSRHWKFLPLARVRNDIVYEPKASRQCHSLREQEEEISNACSTATQE